MSRIRLQGSTGGERICGPPVEGVFQRALELRRVRERQNYGRFAVKSVQLIGAVIFVAACVALSTPVAQAALYDVTDALNLLAGQTTAASSYYGGARTPASAVDNLVGTNTEDSGLWFADSETDGRLSVSGFNSALDRIRVFSVPSDAGRVFSSLTIRSSTSLTSSVDTADYATTLATLDTIPSYTIIPETGNITGYFDVSVFAPSGTQSLLFSFGSSAGIADRISEVQAFAPDAAPVPEPSTFVLALAGLLGLALVAKRQRRKS